MDRHIRKYVLGEARRLPERRKELLELRQIIIDASPPPQDGLPHGKGFTSDPTLSKVMKLEKVNSRIKRLEEELSIFENFRNSLDKSAREIYDTTILKDGNVEYHAMDVGYSWQWVFKLRARMLDELAERLNCYLNTESLED